MRQPRLATALAAAVFGLLIFTPLRHASPTGDDFIYLALGPHLDNPAILLYRDATGSYFFRPVVMLLWWATSAVTREPAVHYAINVALHVGNAVLLLVLARRLGISRTPAALAALVFACHPGAVAAASWLSVRFDLAALGFGLGALIVAQADVEPRDGARARHAGALAALTLACVLSKETGFALAAALFLACLWAPPDARRDARTRGIAAATVAACIVLALALRWSLLRGDVEGLYLRQGLVGTAWGGFANWIDALPGYVVVHAGPASAPWLWGVALAFTALLALAALARDRDRGLVRACGLGLALAALAALVQAPVAAASDLTPFAPGPFSFMPVTAARLYYTPLAGLCLAGAAIGEALARSPLPRWSRRAAAAAMAVAAIALLTQARYVGRNVTEFTNRTGPEFLRAALQVLLPRTAAPGCKIYLLGTPEAAQYFRAFLQTTVLQALPREHPVARCFLLSEHAPWYNVLQGEGLPGGAERPLAFMTIGGRPFAPLVVGNLTYFFLTIPDSDAVRDDPAATFFAWEAGRFVDVTAEVRSRRRAVRFIDNRPPS